MIIPNQINDQKGVFVKLMSPYGMLWEWPPSHEEIGLIKINEPERRGHRVVFNGPEINMEKILKYLFYFFLT